jgi:UDP-GlcNAc:undecaprenyl-phosphate GlcNAc-1-phosphate transferase
VDLSIDTLLAAMVAVGVGAVVANLAVPLVRDLALALRAVDHPGGRKQHGGPVPRMGGIAVAAGMVAGIGSAALGFWKVFGETVGSLSSVSLVLGTGIVFLLGVVEDLRGVSVGKRLLVELAAAWLIVSSGWSFSYFGLPLFGDVSLGLAAPVVSVLWIVGVTNAVNLLDGLDGLAAGVVAIIAGSMMVYGLMQGSLLSVIVLAGMFGACAGFLRHNWEPARIFLGDSGALTLGFLLAAVSVRAGHKASAAVAILVPILALGVPVIDTLMVMVVRFLESPRGGARERMRRIVSADRLHLHHLLESFARRRSSIVRWVYLMVLVSCVMALTVAFTKNGRLGWVLVAVELVAIAMVRQQGWARLVRRPHLVGLDGDQGLDSDVDEASSG